MPIPPFVPILQNHLTPLKSGDWGLVYDIELEYSSSAAMFCETFSKCNALLHKKHSKVLPVLRSQGLTTLGP